MADLDVLVKLLKADGTTVMLTIGDDDSAYEVTDVGLGEGARSWRRTRAQSPFVAGYGQQVAAVLDGMTSPLQVRVKGSTHAQLATRMAALRSALETDSWVLQYTIEGQTTSWRCDCADTTVGDSEGVFNGFELMAVRQTLTALVPHDPYPL